MAVMVDTEVEHRYINMDFTTNLRIDNAYYYKSLRRTICSNTTTHNNPSRLTPNRH
ncbi:MAG: Uncharacterised protein [SAR92 bacterium MED-G29]|nr:MAG: Uncharacterised protein [SAR92 bacterium MED-G29]